MLNKPGVWERKRGAQQREGSVRKQQAVGLRCLKHAILVYEVGMLESVKGQFWRYENVWNMKCRKSVKNGSVKKGSLNYETVKHETLKYETLKYESCEVNNGGIWKSKGEKMLISKYEKGNVWNKKDGNQWNREVWMWDHWVMKNGMSEICVKPIKWKCEIWKVCTPKCEMWNLAGGKVEKELQVTRYDVCEGWISGKYDVRGLYSQLVPEKPPEKKKKSHVLPMV